ncbi:MAG: nucleotide sugar dehydrogenase, partial [Eubacteriaceae bacterium]|nr:nucleotide sugar dehydrogenase [Eubacteriaceae bacterium]
MRISVVGLGYIGLPTALVLCQAGHKVFGFDTNPAVIRSLNAGVMHIKEDSLNDIFSRALSSGNFLPSSELKEADCFIIAVPTPFIDGPGGKRSDLSFVFDAAREVGAILEKGALVILESTVPPGATAKMADILSKESGLGRDEFHTAHCPERVMPGSILREIASNDRIVGSDREESALLAKGIYASFVKGGEILVTDDITAEMCKLVENAFRDVNIAFANEIAVFCETLGIDVHSLIQLANRHPRVNILEPGVGVGGHCIAVDPWFLVEEFQGDARLVSTARLVNDEKPYRIANRLMEKVSYDKSSTIGILGLAYKADIDDFRESPSIVV